MSSEVTHRVLVATVVEIIDQIEALARTLPQSVPKAERNGEIWRVLNKVNGMDTGTHGKSSTFIRRMDILFGSTARDPDGRMTQIRRGSSGILLLIQYLRKINWKSDGIPLAVATLKLTQLLEEMQHLCAVIPTSPTTSTPASPTSSKKSAGEAPSDSEEFAPSKRIRSTRNGSASVEDSEDSEHEDEPSPAARMNHKSKRTTIILSSDSESDSSSQPAKKKMKTGVGPSRVTKNGDRIRATKSSHKSGKTSGSDPTVLGEDEMLADIEVQPLRDEYVSY
ncbi:hypothetical protein B0H14DRAFT_3550066 [Mycena olivaceomarginata]|nr:hypothetical protein B0H14DRAFT_3550066 [Mycena olivaceomarginata]